MRNLLAAAVLIAITGCMPTDPPAAPSAAPMSWADHARLPRGTADASFRYGPDPYQVVDLWRPAGPGPHPVVLMVHGGCWTTSIADRTLMNPIATDLRRRGYAVWNIDYRGVDRPGGGYPGTFADAAAAADLLRREAPAQHLDLTRVIAIGHSAGGHLALWLAGRPRLPVTSPLRSPDPLPIAGVVSLGGLPDLEQALAEPQGCGTQPIESLLGVPRPDRFADTSVPRLAPLGVAQHLVNGDADRIIPTHFAHDYATRMRATGDRVTVEMIPAAGHVELITPTTPAWTRAVAAIARLRTP